MDLLFLVMEYEEGFIFLGGSRVKCVVRLEGVKYIIGKFVNSLVSILSKE